MTSIGFATDDKHLIKRLFYTVSQKNLNPMI